MDAGATSSGLVDRPAPAVVPPAALPAGLAKMPPGPGLAVALAGVDPTRLTAHQLVVVVAAHNRQIAHQQGQLLVALRELGHAPPAERERVMRDRERNAYATVEAAFGATWTAYRCEQMAGLAEFAFDHVPALGRALAEGRVDLDQVKVFDRALSGVAELSATRAIVDQALAKAASDNTATLRTRLQRLLAKRDPGSLRKRRQRDHKDRFVIRFPEPPSDLVNLQIRFCDPALAAAAYDNVDAIAKATKATGDAHGRTMEQLRHDIALDLLAGVDPTLAGHATPADRKGTIVVHVNLATLVGIRELLGSAAVHGLGRPQLGVCGLGSRCGLGSSDGSGCGCCRRALADLVAEPGEIAGYGPVAAHIARQTVAQWAGVSQWRFVAEDDGHVVAEDALPRNLVPGLLESMRRWAVDATAGPDGRAHRLPTAAQIAFVRARDRRCQAPGCRVPAHTCQVDHRIPWHRGGPTFVDNLHCLCLRHHRAKDDGGHRYRRVPAGIEWTTAAGHRYLRATDGTGTRRHRHRHRRSCHAGGTMIVDVVIDSPHWNHQL